MRTCVLALMAVALATPLAAQDHSMHTAPPAAPGALPDGWQVRLDRANASMESVKFVRVGEGYHATLGPSAIFYDPAHRAAGEYTAGAAFTQTRATQHPEGYGIIVGGRDLDGANQEYLYFLVRQDGQFLIKQRVGGETHTIHDWTEHAAITKLGGDGTATNALAVEAGAQHTRFLVNGVEVAAVGNAKLDTAGIAGLRINHGLDVHVGDFRIQRASR